MNVYATKFENLTKLYTQDTSEVWRSKKFEDGLEHKLKRNATPMSIRGFPTLMRRLKWWRG